MKRRKFIAGAGGVCAAWPLTVRGQHTAVPLVRLLAGVLLAVGFSLPTGASAGGQTAPVTSDDKFVDGLIADLGFQPRELIGEAWQLDPATRKQLGLPPNLS
jgi:hypothetical protein